MKQYKDWYKVDYHLGDLVFSPREVQVFHGLKELTTAVHRRTVPLSSVWGPSFNQQYLRDLYVTSLTMTGKNQANQTVSSNTEPMRSEEIQPLHSYLTWESLCNDPSLLKWFTSVILPLLLAATTVQKRQQMIKCFFDLLCMWRQKYPSWRTEPHGSDSRFNYNPWNSVLKAENKWHSFSGCPSTRQYLILLLALSSAWPSSRGCKTKEWKLHCSQISCTQTVSQEQNNGSRTSILKNELFYIFLWCQKWPHTQAQCALTCCRIPSSKKKMYSQGI